MTERELSQIQAEVMEFCEEFTLRHFLDNGGHNIFRQGGIQ